MGEEREHLLSVSHPSFFSTYLNPQHPHPHLSMLPGMHEEQEQEHFAREIIAHLNRITSMNVIQERKKRGKLHYIVMVLPSFRH